MSKGRKNNHYHYAEKFEDRSKRSVHGKTAYVPFKSVIVSLLVLLLFGLVCTTFSTYISDAEPPYDPDNPTLLMQARNLKASHDIALTGADADLAATGSDWMKMVGGGTFIFDNTNTGWSSVQLVVGRQYTYGDAKVYCRIESMTQISHTNLYYYKIDNWATSGDDQYIYNLRFVTGSNYNTGNFSPTDSGFLNSCTHYTGVFRNDDYEFDKDSVYHCYAASSTNGASLSCHYRSTGKDYFNYDQTIRSYTKNANTSGNYNQINDGGTISGSSYKLNTISSSTSTSEGDGKVVAALTATVTLKATAASGYRFVGWYNSSNTQLTNGVGGYTIGIGSDNKPYISYTCTGAVEIRARFIKTYTVTVTKMSGYTGTAPTGTATVDIGSSVTATATTPTGVSFTNWSISSGASYTTVSGSSSSATWTLTPSSNFTLTANYSLGAPSNLSLAYDAYKVVGYSSYAPTSPPSADSATGSGSGLHYSYSIARHSSNSASLAPDNTFSVDSSGAVTASVPGKYNVTMTVYDVRYGLTSASVTKTVTVEVKPEAPSFNYSVSGYSEASGTVSSTGTTPQYPYQVPINRTHTSGFSVTSGLTGNAGYTYNWTSTDGTNSKNYTTTTASANGNRITDTVENPETVLHAANEGDYTYTVSASVSYNGVTSLSTSTTIYYTVTSEFLEENHFNFDDEYDDPSTPDVDEGDTVQKIYAVDNDLDQIYAGYEAGGTNFDTILFFSKDNRSFTPIQVFSAIEFQMGGKYYNAQPDDTDFGGSTNEHATNQPYDIDATTNYLIFNLPVLAEYVNAENNNAHELVNVMQRSGVKYFKGFVYDYEHTNIGASQPTLHTTVGTSSAAGARPIYFKDTNTYTNTRLMAYFVNADGEITYQTAADYNSVVTQIDSNRTDRTGIYRFYAPSDAVSVCFAYTTTTAYVLPTVSNGTFSFGSDSTVFPAISDVVPLDADYNMYKISTRTADGNGIYNYTGAWTNLDMDS